MQYSFGTGTVVGTSRKTGVQTPFKFGVLQDVMVDERSFCGTTMAARTLDPDAAHLIAARLRNGTLPATTIAAVLGDAAEAAFGAQVLKAA